MSVDNLWHGDVGETGCATDAAGRRLRQRVAGVRRQGRAEGRQLHAAARPHEDHPRRQRLRQVDDPEADSGTAEAGRRRDLGERRARRQDERAGADGGARRPRHGVPGGRAVRLADRGGERRLQAVRRDATCRRTKSTPASRRCSGSSGWPSTSTACRRSSRAGSAGASRLRARWPPSRGILLYDEATTGLDPITAITVDEEMIKLRDLENVSSIIVTHQLRDAFFVATHEAVRDARTDTTSRRPTQRSATKRSSSC